MCDLEKNKEEKERESAQKMLQNAQIFFSWGVFKGIYGQVLPRKCSKMPKKCSKMLPPLHLHILERFLAQTLTPPILSVERSFGAFGKYWKKPLYGRCNWAELKDLDY